jgi:hypothetical protein
MTAPFRLFTCSYSEFRPAMGLGVRASLGTPRWIHRDEPWPYVSEITPRRSYLNAPYDEYEAAYLHQLAHNGVDRIGRRFRELSVQHQAQRLVVLCFEKLSKPGAECHRSLFAAWWEQQTGQPVAELGEPPTQDGLFDLGGVG